MTHEQHISCDVNNPVCHIQCVQCLVDVYLVCSEDIGFNKCLPSVIMHCQSAVMDTSLLFVPLECFVCVAPSNRNRFQTVVAVEGIENQMYIIFLMH